MLSHSSSNLHFLGLLQLIVLRPCIRNGCELWHIFLPLHCIWVEKTMSEYSSIFGLKTKKFTPASVTALFFCFSFKTTSVCVYVCISSWYLITINMII